MHELVINLHMHTTYSDGSGSHANIAQAALKTGLDAVIVTDHNVLVGGQSDYYHEGNQRVLLMVGEEIHDQTRLPQKNHLLVFGVNRELAPLAGDPQHLLETVREAGGLAFIAHPVDPPAPAFGEPDISWVDWEVQDFTGIELWNGLSEFKSLLKNKFHAVFYAFNPKRIAHSPFPETLRKWDELLARGRPVVAIGGSDAHAGHYHMGPLHRTLFPYDFHFRSVNTHLFVPAPLTGEAAEDRRSILDALRAGHAFVGYDLPTSTRGFRFTAQGKECAAWMGGSLPVRDGITLQINLPRRVECHLLKDGKIVKSWRKREICTYITNEPGIYRVEAYINFLGRRGWIYSNPIYVQPT
ncbi:MAG TPA: CehA/McbA family metallohydrolase [Anaerolineales bacterium]|nr:CehA/McbA family metallohydrolase [Anaerolineales bacterium]